jgi:hypothetical protein
MRMHPDAYCSGYASVPDAYAPLVLKGLGSVHVLVPDAYAQCTHQFLTRMLSTHQLLTRMLSIRIKGGAYP